MKLSNAQLAVAIASCIRLCSAYPKLIIAGGANVADRSANGAFRGWSALVAPFLNLSLINTAVSPSSVRTTFNSSQWERTLSFVKKGDFLVLEFGIEDEGDPAFKPKNGSYNLRPSLSGTGDETITLNYTTVDTVKFPNGTTKVVAGSAKNVTEVVHTFGWYLKNMIVDARDKEAHVIISSRIPKNWKPVAMTGNKTIDTLPTDYKFRDYAQQVAKELFVDFVDHTQYTLRYLREKGPVASNKLYGYREPRNNQEIRTDVYLSRDGGKATAETFLQAVKCAGNELAGYLSAEGLDAVKNVVC